MEYKILRLDSYGFLSGDISEWYNCWCRLVFGGVATLPEIICQFLDCPDSKRKSTIINNLNDPRRNFKDFKKKYIDDSCDIKELKNNLCHFQVLFVMLLLQTIDELGIVKIVSNITKKSAEQIQIRRLLNLKIYLSKDNYKYIEKIQEIIYPYLIYKTNDFTFKHLDSEKFSSIVTKSQLSFESIKKTVKKKYDIDINHKSTEYKYKFPAEKQYYILKTIYDNCTDFKTKDNITGKLDLAREISEYMNIDFAKALKTMADEYVYYCCGNDYYRARIKPSSTDNLKIHLFLMKYIYKEYPEYALYPEYDLYDIICDLSDNFQLTNFKLSELLINDILKKDQDVNISWDYRKKILLCYCTNTLLFVADRYYSAIKEFRESKNQEKMIKDAKEKIEKVNIHSLSSESSYFLFKVKEMFEIFEKTSFTKENELSDDDLIDMLCKNLDYNIHPIYPTLESPNEFIEFNELEFLKNFTMKVYDILSLNPTERQYLSLYIETKICDSVDSYDWAITEKQ